MSVQSYSFRDVTTRASCRNPQTMPEFVLCQKIETSLETEHYGTVSSTGHMASVQQEAPSSALQVSQMQNVFSVRHPTIHQLCPVTASKTALNALLRYMMGQAHVAKNTVLCFMMYSRSENTKHTLCLWRYITYCIY